LIEGIEYVLGVPAEEIGIRKFCLIPIVLAAATLDRLLQNRADLYNGDDIKIRRALVFDLLNQVNEVVADNQRIRQLWTQLTSPLVSASRRFALP
jgi:farnesyl-diphosphate farnesyltransferase